MSDIVGKIKFFEDKIVTTKGSLVEVWTKFLGDESKFIVYNGDRYKLQKSKDVAKD